MNSLRSLGRAIEYEIERQIERARVGRADRAGDPPLGRGRRPHALDAHRRKGRTTTATSPSPTSCRSRPTDEMRAAVRGARCPSCRRRGGPGSWTSGGSARTRPGCSSTRPVWPTTPRRRWPRSTAARRRTSSNWCNGDVLGHLNETGLVARGAAARARRARRARRPRRRGHDLAQPGQGRARRVPARAEAPEAGRRGARARAGERRRRARRGRRRGARRQRRRRRGLPRRRRQGDARRSAASSWAR